MKSKCSAVEGFKWGVYIWVYCTTTQIFAHKVYGKVPEEQLNITSNN